MRKQTLWSIAVVFVVAVVCLAFWAFISQYAFRYDSTVSEIAAETNDRNILEGNIELKIPANATDIHGYIDGFRDVTTHLRFTLSAHDLDTFLKQTSCSLPLYNGAKQAYWMQNSEHLSWWRPGDVQRFATCADTTSQLGRRFFFDMTLPDQYVVYVVASTR